MNNLITYGQTFSKGQLTIPKKIRDHFDLGENFAYKITSKDKKIIIEPQVAAKKSKLYSALLKIKKPTLTDQDYQDYLEMRKESKKRAQKMGI